MRLIKPSFEIWEQSPSEIGIYKQIERAGRVCYKSEDRLTEDSYKRFVEMLKSHAHGAMLEHGTVYLKFSHEAMEAKYGHNPDPFGAYMDPISALYGLECKYGENPYSKINHVAEDGLYVTTNYRVLVENGWLNDLEYLCEPTEFHEKRVTVHFVTDRGVSHEFVRHRTMSFAQESTRYCNYSKDKFGNELTFIVPSWLDIEEGSYGMGHSFGEGYFWKCNENETFCPRENKDEFFKILNFLKVLNLSSQVYMSMLSTYGLTPQQARQVLPNALKTELVMTGFVSDWEHFFELRCAKDAHPDARALAIPLREEFVKRGYIQ